MIALPGHHTCATVLAVSARDRILFGHSHRAEYLPEAPEVSLSVTLERGPGEALRMAATDRPADAWLRGAQGTADVAAFARHFGVPVLELHRPLMLAPVVIPKPWGREHWYTGIEARGQSCVVGEGGRMPLPWLLALAREAVLGDAPLGLLKVLDPLPDPVYGDLYFELHEVKQEVYVVTGVDSGSWPGGAGAIRFGFEPAVRAEHGSDAAFRAAYLASVERYRDIRHRIDALQDRWRDGEGLARRAPLPAAVLRRWHAGLAPALRLAEREARAAMDRFTHLRPLRVGDVVRVPPGLPHALQHGVRTVEFQTPIYERRILSFAQKVLTQDHWDTRRAAADMLLEPPAAPVFPVLPAAPGVRCERIAEFAEFEVLRMHLEPGASGNLGGEGRYLLVMVVTGSIAFDGRVLGPESAMLVPAGCRRRVLRNLGQAAAVLISRPR